MNKRTKAILYLLITAALWSTGGFLIKYIHWNPMAIAGGRSLIAAIVLWAYLGKPMFTMSTMQLMGAIAYSLTVILFVIANKLTTAANTIVLQYTAPIYVAIFSYWFLKETITKIDWITIALVIVGMGLFFVESLSSEGMLGNIVAIMAGIAFAWLALCLRKQKDSSPTESILLGNLLTAAIGIPFMIQAGLPSQESVLALIALGTLQLGLPYILYAIALKHVTALDAVLFPILEPLLNPFWVYMLHGEKPGMWPLIGGGIILVAVSARSFIQLSVPNRQD